jgi:hypothetical protein
MKLDTIVPWGRSYEEYVSMFALSRTDLDKKILGCGDGPATFNATHSVKGGSITSVDPIYNFTAEEIAGRIQCSFGQIISQVRDNPGNYVWDYFSSAEELGNARLEAMKIFLADFMTGKKEGRYVNASCPALGLSENDFELSLCSHFLFSYGEMLSSDFHIQAIDDLLHYSQEVRVFPLLALDGKPSPYIETIMEIFSKKGSIVEIRKVEYEFQKGGNELLSIKRH